MNYDPSRLHPNLWTLADVQAALDEINYQDNHGTPFGFNEFRKALENRKKEILRNGILLSEKI